MTIGAAFFDPPASAPPDNNPERPVIAAELHFSGNSPATFTFSE